MVISFLLTPTNCNFFFQPCITLDCEIENALDIFIAREILKTTQVILHFLLYYLLGSQDGVVVISRASHLYDPGSSPHVG